MALLRFLELEDRVGKLTSAFALAHQNVAMANAVATEVQGWLKPPAEPVAEAAGPHEAGPHEAIPVDAWGDAAPEEQFFLAGVRVSMTLVHFDQDVIEECMKLSQAGASAIGTLPRAGTRMGGAWPGSRRGTTTSAST